jgi:hypothetical protein
MKEHLLNEIVAKNDNGVVTINCRIDGVPHKIIYDNKGDLKNDTDFAIQQFLAQEYPDEVAYRFATKYGITSLQLYELYLDLKTFYDKSAEITSNRAFR